MARKAKIKIKLPTPPLGSTVAKVVIENTFFDQKKESDEELIFDYVDSCKDILTPDTITFPTIPAETLGSAYDQCIDDFADLYCSPVTSPTGQIPEGTPPPQVNNFSISQDKFYPGDEYKLAWLIKGIGTYRLTLRINGENTVLAEESFVKETVKYHTIEYFNYIPELPRSVDKVEFILNVFDKDGQPIDDGVLWITTEISHLPIVPTPPVKQFVGDNDPSDAKKEIYYLSQNVADRNLTLSDYKNANLYIDKTKYNSKDLVRENMGSFWIVSDDETRLVHAFKQNLNRAIDVDTQNTTTTNQIRPALETVPNNTFGTLIEKVKYSLNTRGIERVFWVNNAFSTQLEPIQDIAYSYQKPYTQKEAMQLAEKPSSFAVIEQKAKYNFYNRKYEEIHFDIDENLLPNMYFISLNRDALRKRENSQPDDDFTLDPDIRKLVAVDDKLVEEIDANFAMRGTSRNNGPGRTLPNAGRGQFDLVSTVSEAESRAQQTFSSTIDQSSKQPIDIKMYYDYYIKQIRQNPLTDTDLIERAKNIYVPYNFLNNISEYNSNSEMHPMKIEVSFTKPSRSTISSILKQSKIGEQVMLSCLTKFQKNTETRQFETIKQEFDNSETNFFEGTNRYIGMDTPMNLTGSSLDEFIYLGDYRTFNNSQAGGQQQRFDFAEFSNRLHYIIKDKIRNYSEILEGKKCYRETLYYRIAKYSGEELIQNIWLPNDPDQNMVKYIDTQVKYDKTYKYRIYTYDFVLGNSYKSINNDFLNMIVTISNTPKLFLVENIFDEIEAKVKDLPPLSPSMDIHSYFGVDNKILFFLEKSFGRRKEKEVIIKPQDIEPFQEIRDAQNLQQDELIEFSGDDIIKEYEVFRTDIAPKSYKDFETATTTKITTQIEKNNPDQRKSDVCFIDSIVPNKKYYYTIRCVDIHNQLSNPSPVMEIEMINENGTIFLLKNVYSFDKINNKKDAKQFNRFLMIKPDVLQETFILEQGASKNARQLREKIKENIYSSQQDNIWDKKYKLRLVSKNTNKVYDINFKFGVETKIIE